MISSLLVLAQATGQAAEAAAEAAADHAHGAAASGITQITREFGIDLPLILAQALSFTIVAFLLWKFAFKPVLATLDERQQKIDAGLKYADEMKAQLALTQQKTEVALREAQQKSQTIIAEAQKAAKDFSDRQQKDAIEKANGIIAKAQQAIELEKKKMLAEARTEIARLVVATTQRVLAKELTEADRARYIESASRELSSV